MRFCAPPLERGSTGVRRNAGRATGPRADAGMNQSQTWLSPALGPRADAGMNQSQTWLSPVETRPVLWGWSGLDLYGPRRFLRVARIAMGTVSTLAEVGAPRGTSWE